MRLRKYSGHNSEEQQHTQQKDAAKGLARDYHHLECAEASPNLTPFTLGVSCLGAQMYQVRCVYQFRHPGKYFG